jgi:putrescine---pyruvate transaminase
MTFENTAVAQDSHFLHPWHPFDYYKDHGPSFMVEGKGCHLYDENGKAYLDAVGGLWCTNIGMGRQEMADVISEQAVKLCYANPFGNLSSLPAAHLSAKLAELAPKHLGHVYYGGGGSDVLDSAFRIIQYYQNCRSKPQKKHFVARDRAYHGTTYAMASMGGIASNRSTDLDFITETIHHISAPYYYRNAAPGMTEEEYTDSLVKEFTAKIDQLGGPDKVAAFYAEPVMGGGGVIVPPKGYLQRMGRVCKDNDILFVADEVVTGFGRLGHWFASASEFGLEPDIIAVAKGLTSGYQPLGAGLLSDQIWSVISEYGRGRVLTNGYTYSAHTVACAAALKNIEIFERERILAHVMDVGSYFEEQIKTLSDLDIIGDVRGLKFMMGIEFVSNKRTKDLFPESAGIAMRITKASLQRGLIVRPAGHLNIMSPALIMNRADVDFCVRVLRESIEATMSDLRKEGLWSPHGR